MLKSEMGLRRPLKNKLDVLKRVSLI
jgi:hypothetical protein